MRGKNLDIVASLSTRAWDSMTRYEQQLTLLVDDHLAGRFGVREFQVRLRLLREEERSGLFEHGSFVHGDA